MTSEKSQLKNDRLILALLMITIMLLLYVIFKTKSEEIGIGLGDRITLVNPETKKELPLQSCGQECQLFTSQNRIIGTTSAQIIDSERLGSATCCTTVSETTIQEGVATTSTMETCCHYPEKSQCKPKWWKKPGYANPQSCSTKFQ